MMTRRALFALVLGAVGCKPEPGLSDWSVRVETGPDEISEIEAAHEELWQLSGALHPQDVPQVRAFLERAIASLETNIQDTDRMPGPLTFPWWQEWRPVDVQTLRKLRTLLEALA
jgi:hypothetical protein